MEALKYKSVYQRIEDEARCELNKVQQQILSHQHTAAAAVRGRNCGDYLFPDGKLVSADGHCTCHPAAVHSPDKIPQPPVFTAKIIWKRRQRSTGRNWLRWTMTHPASTAARNLQTLHICMLTTLTYSARIRCSNTSTVPVPNREDACWPTGWGSILQRRRIYWSARLPYANLLPN